MPPRPHFGVLRLLIGDTFRQANASGISAMMLGVTVVCSLLCLSVNVSGDVSLHDADETVYFLPSSAPGPKPGEGALAPFEADPDLSRREGIETVSGRVSLAFGAVNFPITRERADAVRFLETLLAGGIAGTFGLLLALVWTAGFVPTFLEPRSASVLIAMPVSRRQLLVGKYCSVLAYVGVQVSLFVVLTWLSLGARTRVWDLTYLGCIPLLMLQFAVFYSFSLLLAVVTRSTVACVFGSLLFWLLSWGINYGSVMARGMPASHSLSAPSLVLTDAAYWVSPKPIDSALTLFNALDARHHFEKPEVFRLMEARQNFSPLLSNLSSLVLCGVLLLLSASEFHWADY